VKKVNLSHIHLWETPRGLNIAFDAAGPKPE
jgi:hypothetical protein